MFAARERSRQISMQSALRIRLPLMQAIVYLVAYVWLKAATLGSSTCRKAKREIDGLVHPESEERMTYAMRQEGKTKTVVRHCPGNTNNAVIK